MTDSGGAQAVDRAARLLTEVIHSPDPVTIGELAAAVGLSKTTTSRLLFTLVGNGLVRRDDQGRFLPGEVFVRFAWRGGAKAGLVELAQPFLDRLGKATRETINLGVTSDGMVEQIAQVDSTYMIGGTDWVGLSVPLHCSALGKVLLAHGAARPSPGQLEWRTGKTITSHAVLEAELADVRSRGYAVTDEELEPGLIAVAAPVYRYDGAVVAAISVSGPALRLARDRVSAAAGCCVQEAAALSVVLGYRPQEPPTASPVC